MDEISPPRDSVANGIVEGATLTVGGRGIVRTREAVIEKTYLTTVTLTRALQRK